MKKHVKIINKDKGGRFQFPQLSKRGFFISAFMGFGIFLVAALAISTVASVILYKTENPIKFITPCAFSALYISALLGGFAAAKFRGKSSVLCGLAVSIIIITFILIISIPIPVAFSGDYGIMGEIGLRISIIACSITGAFIGSSKKTKKKTKHHIKR